MRALVLLLAPLALALQGCPSCPYDSACDGNTLLTCSLGVDQVVGDPDEQEIPCEAPNPVCLTIDDQRALCGMDATRTCNVGDAPACEGDLLVVCYQGFERATDCAWDGNVCGEADGEARCYAAPLTACEPSDLPSCEGTVRRWCLNRYFVRTDCAFEGDGLMCVERTSDVGTSAYCGRPM